MAKECKKTNCKVYRDCVYGKNVQAIETYYRDGISQPYIPALITKMCAGERKGEVAKIESYIACGLFVMGDEEEKEPEFDKAVLRNDKLVILEDKVETT